MKYIKKLLALSGVIITIIVLVFFFSPLGKNICAAGNSLRIQLDLLSDIIGIIKTNYVEVPDWDKVMQGAVSGLMEELDPHSVYIKKEKMDDIQEQFDGKFEGIGIEFDILNGFITVISPVANSPSERAGLQAGDKLVKINGESAYKITRKEVFKKLRGPKGSQVIVTIKRANTEEFDVTIVRDEIPLYSVSASFMIDDSTGYIFLNRFSATTATEVEDALLKLENSGMKRLIFDLRNNSGGYLEHAIKVTDMFIQGRKKVLYTKGRIYNANEEFFSGWNNRHTLFPLVILINRGSASASEIVSGAVQDLDRGLIIGETSFGKGLVQRQYQLKNGSAIRVTVARYYTPSGRLIQRPYDGDLFEYYETLGEENRDSLLAAHDSTKSRPEFHTAKGRVVYGGGGINPDYHIPFELKLTESTRKILRDPGRPIFKFSSQYTSENKKWKNKKEKYMTKFEISNKEFAEFQKILENIDITVKKEEIEKDSEYLKMRMKAEIAKDFWGYNEFYKIFRLQDSQVNAAMIYFSEAGDMIKINRRN